MGAFWASSARGTLDEPRLDNDANHERGWGGGVGPDGRPGASDTGLVALELEVGRISVPFMGEGGCIRSDCGSSG